MLLTSTWIFSSVYPKDDLLRQQALRLKRKLSIWLCLQLFLCSCAAKPSSSSGQQGQDVKFDRSTNDPLYTGFFNGTPNEQREAWRVFVRDGQYRAANPEDFRLSIAAKQGREGDLQKATERPYVGGDINHDLAYHDFAIIVVDTRKEDSARFGIVIFNQPLDPKGPYETYWLFRDRDLSSTILEWWSGGLAIREYHQDGTYDFCYVNWHPAENVYSCDKTSKR